MTTIGLLITLLGAGSIAANVMRLIDHIDQPAPRHAAARRNVRWTFWRSCLS